MELRRLGKSGLQVSEVGLGCNNFGMKIDRETTHKVVDKAVELGVTLFDAADIYGKSGGSETMLGQDPGRAAQVDRARHQVRDADGPGGSAHGWLATLRHGGGEGSLKRRQSDWIDFYQLHQPDPLTPIGETCTHSTIDVTGDFWTSAGERESREGALGCQPRSTNQNIS